MSKQSERRKQELAKAKAAAKLFKPQQTRQNQNTEGDPKPKDGKENPNTLAHISFIERPGLIVMVATLFGVLAAFAFAYSHTGSIWLLFLFLVTCGQWLRVELKLHPKKYRYSPNFWGLMFFIVSLIVCVGLQVLESANSKSISAMEQSSKPTAQTVVAMPQPDYIEGTKYTQKRLSEIFPFGYSLLFFGQNRILNNEIFKNGMMDWKLDVDDVSINPDFYSGKVTWTIPNVNATPDGTGSQITIVGGKFTVDAPLKAGYARRTGFLLGNKPVMHVMTLGDNQRTPVFAIGFRIPIEGEGRPPNPPYFVMPP
jgi:hypothetical protein